MRPLRSWLLPLVVTVLSIEAASSATPVAPPELQFADLPGWRAPYRDSGGNGVPIVLLHANTGTSASWGPQFSSFSAAGFRVIAFDRRGWGSSVANPGSGPQPGSVAEDLAALAEHLRLPKFHLLGVAGGGFASLDYAAWRPETLRSLVVAASTGAFDEPEMRKLSSNLSFEGSRALPESFREISPSFRASYPERVAEWAHAQESARQPDAKSQSMRTPNTFAKLKAIRMPLLAIAAGADLLAPPPLMRRWVSELPQAEWSSIADAGHSVPMEQPEAFNATVLAFLKRH